MKEIVALFDRPVILPGDRMEKVPTYGLIFRPSNIATFNNISRFIKEYIVVLSTIFQDKEAEVCNERSFKKGGREFNIDDPTWEQYAQQAQKAGIRFTIFCSEIREEDRCELLLTSEDKWRELKTKVSCFEQVDVRTHAILRLSLYRYKP